MLSNGLIHRITFGFLFSEYWEERDYIGQNVGALLNMLRKKSWAMGDKAVYRVQQHVGQLL